jgi:queuine/archaeosine tRNA-ribosyltransferase
VAYYQALMQRLRHAIATQQLQAFRDSFRARLTKD